ncbi:MAG TPA: hypothetical protein ENI61_05045 [Ignavibacteria bacterium]|nr:hypothetical protein [Ignavibacteria bacterium]
MPITLARVINEQSIPQGISRDGSILLDKIDKSQGNSEQPPYAQVAKQKLYVPYVNNLDPAVKGYSDLVQTDEVILQLDATNGSIGTLANTVPPVVSISLVASNLLSTSTVSAGVHALPAAGDITISGTTFLSVSPDRTRIYLIDNSGSVQIIEEASFGTHTATSIVILSANIVGTVSVGWKVQVFANSEFSNQFIVT